MKCLCIDLKQIATSAKINVCHTSGTRRACPPFWPCVLCLRLFPLSSKISLKSNEKCHGIKREWLKNLIYSCIWIQCWFNKFNYYWTLWFHCLVYLTYHQSARLRVFTWAKAMLQMNRVNTSKHNFRRHWLGHDRLDILYRIRLFGVNICWIRSRLSPLACILVDVANMHQSSLQPNPLCNIWCSLCCCGIKCSWVSQPSVGQSSGRGQHASV